MELLSTEETVLKKTADYVLRFIETNNDTVFEEMLLLILKDTPPIFMVEISELWQIKQDFQIFSCNLVEVTLEINKIYVNNQTQMCYRSLREVKLLDESLLKLQYATCPQSNK